ncbi:MAG TPA: hypothetical protein VFZ21_29235 [Gemmatimonadaceae bacterium]|jgi:hypothetical protein|nr:hypothetical protein [Gemmatimonadaceae bacterium]
MSLWGMSWFAAIAVTLGTVAGHVLICLAVERLVARPPRGELGAAPPAEANTPRDSAKRAA